MAIPKAATHKQNIALKATTTTEAKKRAASLEKFGNNLSPAAWEIVHKMADKKNVGQLLETYGSMILSA